MGLQSSTYQIQNYFKVHYKFGFEPTLDSAIFILYKSLYPSIVIWAGLDGSGRIKKAVLQGSTH